MRIDKFLWSVRFYKTRSIATEEVKKNRVSIGASTVKASKEVKIGDVITIRKNQIDYKIEVLQIPKSRLGAKLVALHVVDRTDKEQYEILKMRQSTQSYYRQRGEGRPTKKDRREIEGFLGDDTEHDSSDASDEESWDQFFKEMNENEED